MTNDAPFTGPGVRGIVYAAVGKRYVREAEVSARSVRACLPHDPIILFCDHPSASTNDAFDEVRIFEERSTYAHLDKLIAMRDSPFEKTLFLDVDTFVCEPPAELFDLLDRFDIAMAHDPRHGEPFPAGTGVPAAFPEFNQGVIAFRRSAEMKAVFQHALDGARDAGTWDDQVALRVALYHSSLRVAPLAPEYNCRFAGVGYLSGRAKILHGRIPTRVNQARTLERVGRAINRVQGPRVFVAGRIYLFRWWRIRNFDHSFAWPGGILFRPVREILARAARGVLRKVGAGSS